MDDDIVASVELTSVTQEVLLNDREMGHLVRFNALVAELRADLRGIDESSPLLATLFELEQHVGELVCARNPPP